MYKGMPAKFTACVTGIPEPDFEWFHNGDKMWQTDRIRMDQEGSLLRLTINNVDELDAGKYTLKISNPHGEDSCTADLIYESEYLLNIFLTLITQFNYYPYSSIGTTREEITRRPIRGLRQISEIRYSVALGRPSYYQQNDGSPSHSLVEAVHPHRIPYPRHLSDRDVRTSGWRLVHSSYGDPQLRLRHPQPGTVQGLQVPHPCGEQVRDQRSVAVRANVSR